MSASNDYLLISRGQWHPASAKADIEANIDRFDAWYEAKAAGVYVFGGGINEGATPLMVAADGTIKNETYPQTRELTGGFCVLELPSREVAVQWAAKPARACRCSQELREFHFDPES